MAHMADFPKGIAQWHAQAKAAEAKRDGKVTPKPPPKPPPKGSKGK